MPPRPSHTEAQAPQAPGLGTVQTKSLRAFRKQLQKVVLAYGWVSRGVGSGDQYKKELDTVSVVLLGRLARGGGLIDSGDVREVRELFEQLDVLAKALVVAGNVKGHLYAFVRDVGRNVLNNVEARVEAEAAAVPPLARVFGATSADTALSTGGTAHGMYRAVEALLASESGDTDDYASEPMFSVPPSRVLHANGGVAVGEAASLAKSRVSTREVRPSAARRQSPRAVRPRQGGSPTSRTDEVHAFIQKTGTVGIPAVAAAFPNVSSKTVQRALVALVASGRLIKAGDRRWTQYTAV